MIEIRAQLTIRWSYLRRSSSLLGSAEMVYCMLRRKSLPISPSTLDSIPCTSDGTISRTGRTLCGVGSDSGAFSTYRACPRRGRPAPESCSKDSMWPLWKMLYWSRLIQGRHTAWSSIPSICLLSHQRTPCRGALLGRPHSHRYSPCRPPRHLAFSCPSLASCSTTAPRSWAGRAITCSHLLQWCA